MQPATSSSTPLQASLSIEFLVIGGGMSGLATAFALARSGHTVTVLEKDNFDYDNDGEVCRMPPNMSKIFFRWGLEERVRQISVKSNLTSFSRYAKEDHLGNHIWDEEYLSETGGDFIFAHHSDLRKLTYDLASQAGATIRPNAEAKSIDVRGRSVTLTSGERLFADVIVGADGLHGISRSTLLNGRPEECNPVGLVMYNALIPGKYVRADPELNRWWESPDLHVSCGHRRAALAFPVGGVEDFAVQVYTPDTGLTSKPTLKEFVKAVGCIRPLMRRCIEKATRITRTRVENRRDLDDWVHDDGPLLLVGDAAHPIVPGAIQTRGVALEDAGVLGKLFSHLSNVEQIQSFLYAFEDLRQERCSQIRQQELDVVRLITMPDGEYQQARDQGMRTNHARGLSVFAGDETQISYQWETNRITFTYDPEDDADNWWVRWGALRERAKLSASGLCPPAPVVGVRA